MIDAPGVYSLPVEEYHADPVEGGSLSSTGARKLLPPYCPAIYRWEKDHPVRKDVFDFGHAAHEVVLGAGPGIIVVQADNWLTKAAKEKKAEAHAEGKIPLLVKDHRVVMDMAMALARHPVASKLLDREHGKPEQTLVWRDERTGIWRRALLDWLPDIHTVCGPETSPARRLLVSDYKTTLSANPDAIMRSVYSYGYHQQAAWYLDGVKALGLSDDPAFLFIFQEKTPPYLVTVAELDVVALRAAREVNRAAIDLYRVCMERDEWPGYTDEIELISLPAWVENKYLRESA